MQENRRSKATPELGVPPESGPPDPDPFNPASLRIQPGTSITTEQVITSVPVRRPKRDEFFRVHPDPGYQLDCLVVERDSERDRDIFVVPPEYREPLVEVARPVRLFTCMSRRGITFLWPVKIATDGGRGQRWGDSALKIADQAKQVWVRMWGDIGLGAYAMTKAWGNLAEPKWPELDFRDLLRLAFEGRVVDRPDHPLIRELRGEE